MPQLQDYLFQRIREQLPPGQSLMETVADRLNLSANSTYRRLRGETPLVLEEARTLCQAFGLSLDGLLNFTETPVLFQHMEVDKGPVDFKAYLQGILLFIRKLAAAQEKSIFYHAKEIPFFYQFCFRPVISFHYFFWMKAAYKHPAFQQQKVFEDCLPPDVEELGRDILSVYAQIPSVEIWNTESINGTLQQAKQYAAAGQLKEKEANGLFAGLRDVLAHIQRQAEYGCKFLPGENPGSKKENYRLVYSRTGLGDNSILTQHDGGKTVYLNYDSLNYMFTNDETFCNKLYGKFQNVMRRGTLISSVSEKQRNRFFNALYAKLPTPKNTAEAMP